MPEQEPSVGAHLSTFYSGFRQLFPEILRVLLAHGEAYTPDKVSLGKPHGFRTVPFRPDQLNELFLKWKNEDPGEVPFCKFERKGPAGLVFLIGDSLAQYRTVIIAVRRDFISEDGRSDELLTILKELYTLAHPMYGNISIHEMVKKVDSPLGKVTPGTDLEGGLPDIFWANFLGPEYVEMFGSGKVLSAPCYSVERLPDGGALLLLSPSPFDYLAHPEELDKLRVDIKKHLGIEAFHTGDPSYKGRVPKFRYQEQWKAEQAKYFAALSKREDILSKVPRSGWKDWMENNQAIALTFISEMKDEGLALDFSKDSLFKLDEHFDRLVGTVGRPSLELVKKLGAYVTQVIIRENGAEWSFGESEEIPSLKLGEGILVTPLARVLKVLEQGERFGYWYSRITEVASRLSAVKSDSK